MELVFRFIEAVANGGLRAVEWVMNAGLRIAEAGFNAYFRLVELVSWPFFVMAELLWGNRSLRYKRSVNIAAWGIAALFIAGMLVLFNSSSAHDRDSQLMLTNVMMVLCIIGCLVVAWGFDSELRKNQLRKDLADARKW